MAKATTKAVAATKDAAKTEETTVFISQDDQYVFGQGNHYQIYKKLGAHVCKKGKKKGVFFAVWAPNAKEAYVIGEFNDWNEGASRMERLGPETESNIFATFIEDAAEGQMYKYMLVLPDGSRLYKADPYAAYAEMRPGNASRIYDLNHFKWGDKEWMAERKKKNIYSQPISIYECHIGSWMKHPDGTEDGFYNYREFADRMLEYLKEMPYTHVELMGIAEFPFDGSWGYQVTGYYAPTSRYGNPDDFRYLINILHQNGIGVILDWVPAHFPRDAHGLSEFDGTCLYEHPDKRLGEHPDWGTKIFNYSKTEVRNFLIANALYWINEFHIDGLRVDAVASMLYLDYGKKDGEWVANKYGGNQNLDAIEFFKHLNSVIRGGYPGVMTIAEESTAWPKVTARPEDDGLGFTFKWNMGWMHDYCEYMKLDPFFRRGNHYKLTFAMSYNSSENYILPLSHDEVVHLKCSMLNKMPGYEIDKYANLRNLYTFMFGHEGKKLLFMGQDFAQEREWSEARELDWNLLEQPLHKGMHDYMGALLKLYKNSPCLYEIDNSWDGFEWMNADDVDRSIYSFVRKSKDGKQRMLFIINMTPVEYKKYRVGVPELAQYKLILNSDDKKYGGNGNKAAKSIKARKGLCDRRDQYISLNVAPLSAVVYEF